MGEARAGRAFAPPLPAVPAVAATSSPHRTGAAAARRPAAGALVWALWVVATAALAVFTLSAYWGWRLSHPPRVVPRGDPAVDGRLVWRCLPLVPDSPPCPLSQLPLQSSNLPLSGWILPVRAPAVSATPSRHSGGGSGSGSGPGGQAQPWPGTSPSQWSHDTVVFVTNAGQNRLQAGFPTYAVAREFLASGYNVVLFDTRGTGLSGGDAIGFGETEAADVVAVVNYLRGLGSPGGTVVVWGFGTGGDAAIEAAARDPMIAAVIADSPYTDLSSYLRRNVPTWTGLPAFPFAVTIPWVMRGEVGLTGRPTPLSVVGALGGGSPRPFLLVNGEADTVTPPQGAAALLLAAHDPYGQLWLVPGVGHLGAYAAQPARYMAAVWQTLSAAG